MTNTVNIIITLGLQSDEESGDVVGIILPVTEIVAKKIIEEQYDESFTRNNNAFLEMINAYARLCGYQCGWFIEANQINEASKSSQKNTFLKFKKIFNTIGKLGRVKR